MVNVWNVEGDDAFSHVLFRKPFSYLASLFIFHNHDYIGPGELFFRYWFFVVKACGFCFESVFENLFSCFAPVLVLVAHKKHFHNFIKVFSIIIIFVLLSCNVLAIAVTPSHLDFTNSPEARLVVFNTEDYVRDFYLSVGSGFRVGENSLRIPPRSSTQVRVSCECKDCSSSLYVRELSDSAGIRIEPAVVVLLSSGRPEEDDSYLFDAPESTPSSFDFRKPEVLAFLIISALLISSLLFFFGRKFYKKGLFRKLKRRKKR